MTAKSSRLQQTLSSGLLVLAAVIWGASFVAQRVGNETVGPLTFISLRSLLASTALLPLVFFRIYKLRKQGNSQAVRPLIKGGLLCGLMLTFASSLQQIGMVTTSAGKAGFLTGLYMLMVPIVSLILFKKKVSPAVWIGVILALVGMYLLCVKEDFTITMGDFYVFLCAVCYTGHILCIDHFAPKVDGVLLSCAQFYVCGFLTLIPTLFIEQPTLSAIHSVWMPIAYSGIGSGSIAFTLQIIGQKHVQPTLASLLMSLESVFSAIFGWLLLNEHLSDKELLGCILVFGAVLLAQIPSKKQ